MGRVKDSANYKNIVSSLDFRYGRKQTLGMVFISALCLLYLWLKLRFDAPAALAPTLILCGGVNGVVILWCLIRWLGIFRKPDEYVFFTTVLNTPNLSYRHGVYFTIRGADGEGRPIVANTRRMFHSIGNPSFEKYNNLQVLAGYNQRTGRVIIVRKAIYD